MRMLIPEKLNHFIQALTDLIEGTGACEEEILKRGSILLQDLVRHDDWLPAEFAVTSSSRGYSQYLLYCDRKERFSVVSFVWGPKQKTPIHDHTVWGMIGVLRGAETSTAYDYHPNSKPPLLATGKRRLNAGEVMSVSPSIGDIHEVANALDDQNSISIHVYGANIGKTVRHTFDALTGEIRPFISGYDH